MMLNRVFRLIAINTLKLQQSRTLVTRRTNFRSRNGASSSNPTAKTLAVSEATSQDQAKGKKWTWPGTVLKVSIVAAIASYVYAQKDSVSQLGEFFGIAPTSDLKIVSLSEKYDSYSDAIFTNEHGKKAIAEYRAARKLAKLVSCCS